MKIPKKGQTVAIAFYPDTIAYCTVKDIVKTESELNGLSSSFVIWDDPFVEGAVSKEERRKWFDTLINNRPK